MIRIIKILVVIIVLLLIASIAAMYFGLLNPPQVIKDIPYLNKMLIANNNEKAPLPELSEVDKLRMELEDAKAAVERLEDENAELGQQLTEAEKERDSLKAHNEELNTKSAQLQQLAEYYKEMKVKRAAAIMAELDDDTIVGILTNMGNETAAGIIAELDPQRAAVLTKKILKGGE